MVYPLRQYGNPSKIGYINQIITYNYLISLLVTILIKMRNFDISTETIEYKKKCGDINNQCLDIVKEIRQINQTYDGKTIFISYDAVSDILLKRYGMLRFECPPFPNLNDIPCLKLLKEQSRKINVFVDSYLITNCIVTVYSLHIDLLEYLQSFNIPSLNTFFKDGEQSNKKSRIDPNEISIDNDTHEQPPNDREDRHSPFHDYYGFGCLLSHQIVKRFFPSHIIKAYDKCAQYTNKDMIAFLLEYLQIKKIKGFNNIVSLNLNDKLEFHNFVCDKLSLGRDSLLEASGILLQGDLSDIIQSLKYVLNIKYNQLINIDKHHSSTSNENNKEINSIGILKNRSICNKKQFLHPSILTLLEKFSSQSIESETSLSLRSNIYNFISNCLKKTTEDKSDNEKSELLLAGVTNAATEFLISIVDKSVDPIPPFEFRLNNGYDHHYDNNHSDNICYINSEELRPLLPFITGQPMDWQAAGRWGEALVHQYLLSRLDMTDEAHGSRVEQRLQWMNQYEESKACYDFIMTDNRSIGKDRQVFVEVKTTRFSDLNVFEMSLWEWQFATSEPRVPYHVYRVFNAGDPQNVRIVILKDILSLLTEKKLKLCIAI